MLGLGASRGFLAPPRGRAWRCRACSRAAGSGRGALGLGWAEVSSRAVTLRRPPSPPPLFLSFEVKPRLRGPPRPVAVQPQEEKNTPVPTSWLS